MVVHDDTGVDNVPIVTSLVQLIMEPRFRTIHGLVLRGLSIDRLSRPPLPRSHPYPLL